MYPYSRPATEDEPTITDLRGVLPSQRPPIDPAVLDEPTSEVPVLRSRSGSATTTEPEPAVDAAAETPDADADAEVETTDPEATGTDSEPAASGPEPEPAASDTETEADASGAKAEAETTQDEVTEGEGAEGEVPDPQAHDLAAGAAGGVDEVSEAAEGVSVEGGDIARDIAPDDSATEVRGDEVGDAAVDFEVPTDRDEAPTAVGGFSEPAADPIPANGSLSTDSPLTDARPQGHPISEMSKMTWNPTPATANSGPITRDREPVEPAPGSPHIMPAATAPAAGSAPVQARPPAESADALPGDAAPVDTDRDLDTDRDPDSDRDIATAPVDTDRDPDSDRDVATAPVDTDRDLDADRDLASDDSGTTGVSAAAPVSGTAGTPVSARGSAETPIALWSDQEVERLRNQWRDLQIQFIDDPDAAVTDAKALVTGAVQQLADTLLEAQSALDPHRGSDPDTESMRLAMRRYREFLDRVLAL